MAKKQIKTSADSPDTIQRTYRFNAKTFNAFEEDCATHLSNPKRVIEALILFWLSAKPEVRGTLARNHRDEIGYGSKED
jgi:hypothetical protein